MDEEVKHLEINLLKEAQDRGLFFKYRSMQRKHSISSDNPDLQIHLNPSANRGTKKRVNFRRERENSSSDSSSDKKKKGQKYDIHDYREMLIKAKRKPWRTPDYWALPENVRHAVDISHIKHGEHHTDFLMRLEQLNKKIFVWKKAFTGKKCFFEPGCIKIKKKKMYRKPKYFRWVRSKSVPVLTLDTAQFIKDQNYHYLKNNKLRFSCTEFEQEMVETYWLKSVIYEMPEWRQHITRILSSEFPKGHQTCLFEPTPKHKPYFEEELQRLDVLNTKKSSKKSQHGGRQK